MGINLCNRFVLSNQFLILLESLLTLKGRVFGGSLTLTGKKLPNREISSNGWYLWVNDGKYYTYYNW